MGFYAGKKRRESRMRQHSWRTLNFPGGPAGNLRRQPVADRSPAPAIRRRTRGDQRSTAHMAWESH